jgi:3-hydroxyacyl-CoA dehydrogenase
MVDIKNVVVIGVGQMGTGVAQVALMSGHNVTLVDVKDEFVNKSYASIDDGMKKLEAKGALGGKTAANFMANCKKSIDIASAMKTADLMVEAVIEDMDIKKKVFKTCDENAPKHCIFASNTSTMSITEMANATKRPDKVIGMHFFNPVPLMRCVEVIYGQKSSDESINAGMKFAEKLPCLKGKRYIAKVLKDRPGFIVNRVTAPVQIYQNYIFDLAAEKGVTWEQLDNDSGGPMPTCVLADFVGIDTLFHVQNYYAKTLSPDFAPGKVITKMFKAGTFGAKTRKGFYDWSKGRPAPDKKAGKARLFELKYPIAIMVNEACRVLEEGISKSWKVVDDAVMAGMNTPGPLAPNLKTSAKQVEVLNELVQKTGKKYFTPCELLKSEKWVTMQ